MDEINRRIASLSPEQQALLKKRLQSNHSKPKNQQIPQRNISDTLPLSAAQERMWILHELKPDLPIYNESILFKIIGNLNQSILEKSLNQIIQRHEILRTTFVAIEEKPTQIIADNITFNLPIISLENLTSSEQERQAQEIAKRISSQPFNLTQAPLLRGILLKLHETEHIILLSMHHIISDGWSWGILLRELTTLYPTYSKAITSSLAELPIQYGDFALWEQQQIKASEFQTQLNYWKEKLHDTAPILNLPTDYPRPSVQTFKGARKALVLPQYLTQQLRSLCQQEGVTLFMLLLAVFQTLLYRYTGSEDIVVGTPIANRTRIETESLIGCFINTLVLRTDFSGLPSFRELLARVREVILEAQAHQVPFAELVKQLQPERDLSYNPFFQVMFVFQEALLQTWEMGDLTLEPLLADTGVAKFDLTLFVEDDKQGLKAVIEYNTDLFQADTITRMLGHFQCLLQNMVTGLDKILSDLQLLTAAEQHQLLIEWNDTKTKYSQDKSLQELFEAQVEKNHNAVAVAFAGKQLTYKQLNSKANQLAHYLQCLGVKPEVLVGICVERSIEMVVGLLGILKAGGAYVPLDSSYPRERLAFMLADSQVSVLLTQEHLLEILPPHQAQVVCLDTLELTDTPENVQNPCSGVTAANLAYVIYTSGSTGRPKGAMNAHRGICNRLLWMQDIYQLTTADRVLQKTPFSFDVSVWEFFWTLLNGATLVLAKPGGHRDSAYLVELIATEKITTLHFVPSMLQIFLEEQKLKECKSLKRVICSGEALSKELQERFFSRHNAQLHNLYGPTEAAIDVTYWACKPHCELPTVPIGRPIANTQIYILDSHQKSVPIGITGELHIGGVGLARGYLNRPELTAEKFIYLNSQRLYKTGDLARYLPDGNIEYLGRLDNQVKIRGFRIELGEIEAVLNQHPQVQNVVVVAREDISQIPRLVAYIVPRSTSPSIEQLRDYLQRQLPEYAIPSAFVTLAALPLTPNGKVDRRALPVPDTGRPELEKSFVPPRNPVEDKLTTIWSEVLQVAQIGIYDNFFELGGHSLLATQVISRIRRVFDVELPLASIFELPTVAEEATRIQQAQKIEQIPIDPVARDNYLPLSFAQTRLWFLDQLEGKSATYNMAAALHLTGNLNLTVLERAFTEIVQRHEVLRTTFSTVDGQPVMVIQPSLSIKLPVVDLRSYTDSQREAEVLRLAQAEARQPFDLEKQELLRCLLLHLKESEYVLLFSIHHIVSDGWSTGVLIRELATLYSAFCNDKPSPLAELPIQYADFACWQRKWLQGERLTQKLAYWKQQLKDAPLLLNLPTDKPRPPVQTFRGAIANFQLSSEVTQKLKVLSQQQGVTLFMILLAAFQTLLYRYTHEDDICVGSPIANRNRSEIESLIGFFVNTLVMRTNLSGNPSFIELLNRVRQVTLEAYAHQDLPFEMLVEHLQPERSLSYTPLFQVMFILQNAPFEPLTLPGLTLNLLPIDNSVAKFDLTLSMEETAQGLTGCFEYNTDLFDISSITRIIANFQTLLDSILTNPQRDIGDLVLLEQAERQQLLYDLNNTQHEYAGDKCIHQLFETQVEKNGNALAVKFGEEQLTYKQLNQRSNQIASHLQCLGVEPNVLVGIYLEKSPLTLVAMLGILKAGGAYIPLDPTYPLERLDFMLRDSQARIILTQQHLQQTLPPHQARVVCLDSNDVTSEDTSLLESGVTPKDLAYTIYTSGSTGKPKGVQIPHSAVVNFLQAMQRQPGISASDVLLSVTTIAFDIAALELYLPLITGASLILISRELASDGKQLCEYLDNTRVSIMQATPATWRMLVAAGWKGSPQLKILCGGEALAPDLAKKLLEKACAVWNLYGPTEATIWSSIYQVKANQLSASIPIGRPIANTQIYILDSHQQPVPIGVSGELYIGGVGVGRGYLNRPELTAEKFIYLNSQRLYKTGDLARYLHDGNIEYLGRLDNQVKIRGFRIELGEIEAVLNQHQQVLEAVVVAREDIPGNQRLVAYIVPKSVSPASEKLRDFLQQQLPEYMIPATFVVLEKLPLTPNGKVDRKALPAPDVTQIEQSLILPQTPQEQILTQIWCEVLGIEEISIDDNFFELGGDSILSVQIVSKANQAGLKLTTKQLFQNQTISKLAVVANEVDNIKQQRYDKTTIKLDEKILEQLNLEIQQIEDIYPLSPVQKALLFQTLCAPEAGVNFMQLRCTLTGELNIPALKQSWQYVVQRYSVLRTIFIWENLEQPLQIVVNNIDLPWNYEDLQQLSINEQKIKLETDLKMQRSQGFNLNRAPIISLNLIKVAENTFEFILSFHHIILDGWSLPLVIQDVFTAYDTFCQNKNISLQPSHPYSNYINWLQQQDLSKAATFWQRILKGFTTPTPLNIKNTTTNATQQKVNYDIQKITLSANATVALQSLAQKHRLTLNTIVQGVWALLLNYYSKQQDIVFGATSSGRPTELIEVESMVGLFINTLPVRVKISLEASLLPWLQKIQLQQIEARQYEYSPITQIKKWCGFPGSISLFESIIVFENFPTNSKLQKRVNNLEIKNIHTMINNGYALTLRVVPEAELSFELIYNSSYLEKNYILQKLEYLETLINRIVADENLQLKELIHLLAQVDKNQQIIKQTEREQTNLIKLNNIKRKTIRGK